MQKRDSMSVSRDVQKCEQEDWAAVSGSERIAPYRPDQSWVEAYTTGFSQTSIFIPTLQRPHERRPMASRREHVSALFFRSLNTTSSHRMFSMGYRRAKSTQGNTHFQKRIFLANNFGITTRGPTVYVQNFDIISGKWAILKPVLTTAQLSTLPQRLTHDPPKSRQDFYRAKVHDHCSNPRRRPTLNSARAKKLKVNLTLPLEVDQTTTMYSWREPSTIAILFCCQAWIGADYEKRALFFFMSSRDRVAMASLVLDLRMHPFVIPATIFLDVTHRGLVLALWHVRESEDIAILGSIWWPSPTDFKVAAT